MAISNAMCTSFKQEILQAVHNFTASTGNTFKIALYTSSASLGAGTTAYSAPADPNANPTSTHEVTQTGTNYTAGGISLVNVTPTTSGTTAFTDFGDVTWTSATITANGALIYNSSASNKAVCALAFGGDKSSTSGNFTIVFPAADASNAIIRIAQYHEVIIFWQFASNMLEN